MKSVDFVTLSHIEVESAQLKQAQICAEGCEGENFTHIDTERKSIYSLMVNILQILSKRFTNMKNHYGNLKEILGICVTILRWVILSKYSSNISEFYKYIANWVFTKWVLNNYNENNVQYCVKKNVKF